MPLRVLFCWVAFWSQVIGEACAVLFVRRLSIGRVLEPCADVHCLALSLQGRCPSGAGSPTFRSRHSRRTVPTCGIGESHNHCSWHVTGILDRYKAGDRCERKAHRGIRRERCVSVMGKRSVLDPAVIALPSTSLTQVPRLVSSRLVSARSDVH